MPIGPFQGPVTWYGINYAEKQITQWDSQTKESRSRFVRVPLFWKSHCVICVTFRTMWPDHAEDLLRPVVVIRVAWSFQADYRVFYGTNYDALQVLSSSRCRIGHSSSSRIICHPVARHYTDTWTHNSCEVHFIHAERLSIESTFACKFFILVHKGDSFSWLLIFLYTETHYRLYLPTRWRNTLTEEWPPDKTAKER